MGQHLSDEPRDLATLTITLEVMALVGDTGLRAPSVYGKLSNLEDMTQFRSHN